MINSHFGLILFLLLRLNLICSPFFLVYLAVLGFELRASHLLGRPLLLEPLTHFSSFLRWKQSSVVDSLKKKFNLGV
jgi:hypothetical protein